MTWLLEIFLGLDSYTAKMVVIKGDAGSENHGNKQIRSYNILLRY